MSDDQRAGGVVKDKPMWVPVTVPVEAKIGDVHLRLFPYDSVQTAVDDFDERPWAWGAMCRIKFRFGTLTTSKKISQRYAYCDSLGWARQNRPSDDELAVGRATVLANLRTEIERHGVKVTDLHVIEADVMSEQFCDAAAMPNVDVGPDMEPRP